MNIYVLTTYEYNSYSWDGLKECEAFYYSSKESAEQAVKDKGLTLVRNAEKDTHATIHEAFLND